MQRLWLATVTTLTILISLPRAGEAQETLPPNPALDQLLAPVALYPDPLLAEILTASTYPIEIVQADRWLQNPANAALRNDSAAFQAALAQQSWDSNVKALTFFPQVLQTLDSNIQWTQSLGNAFLTEQPSVMNSIQNLRQLAMNAGNLTSTAQQNVVNQNGLIVIQPTNQQMLYVPYYNATVYGAWPWPGLQPVAFAPPQGVYLNGPMLAFDSGAFITPTWFYFVETNWRYHRVDNHSRPSHAVVSIPMTTGTPQTPPAGGPIEFTPWTHDPAHRYIPAPDEETRARLNPGTTAPLNTHPAPQNPHPPQPATTTTTSNKGGNGNSPAPGLR